MRFVIDHVGELAGVGVVLAIVAGYPLWLLVTFLGIRRRTARRSAGRCVTCGYDVRGNRDRCPECGDQIDRFTTS